MLSTTTGLVSPQFHIIFDDHFTTTSCLCTNQLPSNWDNLLTTSSTRYVDEDFSLTPFMDPTMSILHHLSAFLGVSPLLCLLFHLLPFRGSQLHLLSPPLLFRGSPSLTNHQLIIIIQIFYPVLHRHHKTIIYGPAGTPLIPIIPVFIVDLLPTLPLLLLLLQ